jgi:imidazoleglycerol-phosphate dehydratase / histidinol-phosphatase
MKKALFIDRDGTLIIEPQDYFQIDSFSKLEFMPGVFTWLGKICRELNFELVMVTNQDGLGTEKYPLQAFEPIQNFILSALKNEGIVFRTVHVDPHFESDNAPTRKPGTGMLTEYLSGAWDLKNSFTIGDRLTDCYLASNLGCRAIYIRQYYNKEVPVPAELKDIIALNPDSWKEIYYFLKTNDRIVEHCRKTNETEIRLWFNPDGTGSYKINTGLKFFDHMLEQFCRHGGFSLELDVKGDLEIDEHHTIEDTALALGEAVKRAAGNKKGIGRYAFVLPMDDAECRFSMDFGGRPWLRFEGKFTRDKVGDFPVEMLSHFFKSFSDAASCTLHIEVLGENTHHKIESVFKAFGKCLKGCLERGNDNDEIPTTKGLL